MVLLLKLNLNMLRKFYIFSYFIIEKMAISHTLFRFRPKFLRSMFSLVVHPLNQHLAFRKENSYIETGTTLSIFKIVWTLRLDVCVEVTPGGIKPPEYAVNPSIPGDPPRSGGRSEPSPGGRPSRPPASRVRRWRPFFRRDHTGLTRGLAWPRMRSPSGTARAR